MSNDPILDQSKTSEHGIVHTAAGRPFHLPKLDSLDADSEPAIRFSIALDVVNEAHTAIERIKADQTLSSYGKDQKLAPCREDLISQVAHQLEEFDKFEARTDQREAVLLAVPKLDSQNTADAIIDRELRDWWKDQAPSVRMELLQKMLDEPGHERLEIALLRSPYAQVDREVALAREAWNNAKRLENPAEAEAIAIWRNQHAWGTRAFAHVTPISALLSELPKERVLEVLLNKGRSTKTMQAFGFDVAAIERAKLAIKQRERAGRG